MGLPSLLMVFFLLLILLITLLFLYLGYTPWCVYKGSQVSLYESVLSVLPVSPGNAGPQAWQQPPLPKDPSRCPVVLLLFVDLFCFVFWRQQLMKPNLQLCYVAKAGPKLLTSCLRLPGVPSVGCCA